MALLPAVICVLFVGSCVAQANGIPGIDDDVLYRIDWTSKSIPSDGLGLLISTKLGEKYECDIPTEVEKTKKKEDADNLSVSEIELLNELFSSEPCSVRTEFYWTYELCHKSHIRQYHEEFKPDKTVSSRQEYFLGHLDKDSLDAEAYGMISGASKEPPKVSLGEFAYPYFQTNFTMGDICDLTQRHRVTTVLYICFEEIEGQIVEVAEIESCRYQVIFATRHLCRHPLYRRHHKTVHPILCRPRNASPVKPLGLTTLESEQRELSSRGFSNLAALFESSGLGKLKVEAERRQNMVIYRIRSSSPEDQVKVETTDNKESESEKENTSDESGTDPN